MVAVAREVGSSLLIVFVVVVRGSRRSGGGEESTGGGGGEGRETRRDGDGREAVEAGVKVIS